MLPNQIRITSGPFAEFAAADLEAIAPDRRVFMLMELVGGQTRVAVKADQLRTVGA